MSGLRPGQRAPEIDVIASNGQRWVLSQQQGLCTVLYFFPKAFTPGCTVETKLFRDNYVELLLAGANLAGVSTDDLKTQCDFAGSTGAPFPILPDPDHAISKAYEVLWPVMNVAQRVTFIISPAQEIVAVFRHEVNVAKHRDDVLKHVNELFKARRAEASALEPTYKPA